MNYKFKHLYKAYLVINGTSYRVPLYSDITYNQTFQQVQLNRKTLHNPQLMKRGAIISQANQANFSFTTPFLSSQYINQLLTITQQNTQGYIGNFDLYFQSGGLIHKIQKAVIQNLIFNIQKSQVSNISISGSASRILKVDYIPSQVQQAQQVFNINPVFQVKFDDQQKTNIQSLSLQFSNSITWIPNKVVSYQNEVSYRQQYYCDQCQTSGTIVQTLIDQQVFQYSQSTKIQLSLGQVQDYFYNIVIQQATYTSIININDLLSKTYTFRAVS